MQKILCLFPKQLDYVPWAWHPVVWKLHDKRSRFAGETAGLLQHDAADYDGRHADEVGAGGYPWRAAENRAAIDGTKHDQTGLGCNMSNMLPNGKILHNDSTISK